MMMYLLQNCSLFVKLDQGCLLQVTGIWCILFVLPFIIAVAVPAGPPIGTLFTSASIPFMLKSSCHLKKSFQLFKKRKRTISKRNEENAVSSSSIKKCKLDCDEAKEINSGTKEALVECATLTNDHKVMVERSSKSNHVSSQPEALDVSDCYMTATESFYEDRDRVLKAPEHVISKKNSAKIWRKRKTYSDDEHGMIFISKKKLKLNSEMIIKKLKRKHDTKKITSKGL